MSQTIKATTFSKEDSKVRGVSEESHTITTPSTFQNISTQQSPNHPPPTPLVNHPQPFTTPKLSMLYPPSSPPPPLSAYDRKGEIKPWWPPHAEPHLRLIYIIPTNPLTKMFHNCSLLCYQYNTKPLQKMFCMLPI